MKIQKKLTACFMVCMMLVGLTVQLWDAAAYAAEIEQPSYLAKGTYSKDENTFRVDLLVGEVADAISGRFALAFDKDLLELPEGNEYPQLVLPTELATTESEGRPVNELVSQAEGYVLINWLARENSIPAKEQFQPVAAVEFRVKAGFTDADFNWDTLKIKYVATGQFPSWVSSAEVSAKIFYNDMDTWATYRMNATNGFACIAKFEYPNQDQKPANLHYINLKVMDTGGAPVSAQVSIGAESYPADEKGEITTLCTDGVYEYSAVCEGYETKTGTITVAGQDMEQEVVLRTDQEWIDDIAKEIEIEYQEGDRADAVTRDIGLNTLGAHGAQIKWASDQPGIVSVSGGVTRMEEDRQVKLTAMASKNGKQGEKEFHLTVLAKPASTPEPTHSPEPSAPVGGGSHGSGTRPTSAPTPTASPTPTPTPESTPSSAPMLDFKDLDNVPWAQEAILILADEGIIKGTGKESFSPENNIKRGDFIALLMRMLAPQGQAGDGFTDVPETSYYFHEIALAKSLGIAQGTGNNRFEPETFITRQDMMTITCRALYITKTLEEKAATNAMDSYADSNQVADYAKPYVARLIDEKYIAGNDKNEINPVSNTTRAETAVFLYRIYMSRIGK